MRRQQWDDEATAPSTWGRVAAVGGVVAPLGVFGVLAENVGIHYPFGWDGPLMRSVHGYASPAHEGVMIVVTQVGGVRGMLPLCALIVGILLWRRQVRSAVLIALAYAGAEGLDSIAKALVRSPRLHLWPWGSHEAG